MTGSMFKKNSDKIQSDKIDSKKIGGNWPIAFCACLPFLFSIGIHSVEPTPTKVKGQVEKAGLTFRQYSVNLRTVEMQSVVPGRFYFTNTSKNTIKINKLEASCGCLNPRLPKKIYEPGEIGYFDVRVSTPNSSPGKKEYTIDVIYDDPKLQTTELTFKFILPEKMVMVRPLVIHSYVSGTELLEKNIKVMDYREGNQLQISHVECISLKNRVRIDVPVSLVDLKLLNESEIDKLYANAASQLKKQKTVTVSNVTVSNVTVTNSNGQISKKRNKVVQANGEFQNSKLKDQKDELKIERESLAGMVNLKIDPMELKKNSKFLVRIYTNDPKYPVITVPLSLNRVKTTTENRPKIIF